MKLAEALQERADINRKIEQLRSRLNNNALVQEGETPAEDPAELKKELDRSLKRLSELIAAINRTNSLTAADGMTLTELIAKKDTLVLALSVYRDVIDTAGQSAYRARNTEIKIMPAISVKEWQKQADDMAKELRLTDNLLQEKNWSTELIE